MRRVAAKFSNAFRPSVHRAVRLQDLAGEWEDHLDLAVLASNREEISRVEELRNSGLDIDWLEADGVQAADLFTADISSARATVLFRESDVHHGLLLTNRCNSYCLMCSQPPTKHDDSWLIDQAIDIARHIRVSPDAVGLSGGEPLLLGEGLRQILDAFAIHHPSTVMEVLTNGRLLGNDRVASETLKELPSRTRWLVPLYGHADFLHDFIVQSHGAFEETIAGLLSLQEYGQAIQLRIVLIRPVLEVLPELCSFIARNLPFVSEVALMACEPIGFALANRELCEVDLADYETQLLSATRELRRRHVPFLFMNAPLCALPAELRGHAHKSISDWKNVFVPECDQCAVKSQCSGLFAWHERGWTPSKVRPLLEEVRA